MKAFRIFLFSLFLFTVVNVSFVEAQSGLCPDADEIPPNVPWIDMGTVMVPIGNGPDTCMFWVTYCYREIGASSPVIEVFVHALGPVDIDCYNNKGFYLIDASQEMHNAALAILLNNPDNKNWPCPPCPITSVNYRFFYDDCRDKITGEFCYTGRSFCRTEVRLCCNGSGEKIYEFGNTNSIGNSCGVDCEPICYTP